MDYKNISALITNSIDDIVYISDPTTYEIYYVNEAVLKLLKYPPTEKWKGEKCYKLLQNRDEPCTFCTNNILCHEDFYTWEFYNELFDTHFLLKDKLIYLDNKEVRLEIASDITKRVNLENNLTSKLEEQQVLNFCIENLNSPKTAKESVGKLLEVVTAYYNGHRSYIFDISENGEKITNTYEWCVEGAESQIDNLQNIDSHIVHRWFHKFHESGEFYISSLSQELDHKSEEFKILNSLHIHSIVTAPILNKQGKLIGFVGVDNPNDRIENTNVIRAISKFISDYFEKNILTEKLNQLTYIDQLTELKNRYSYSNTLSSYEENTPTSLGVIYIDIKDLEAVDNINGHKYGDDYIISFANILRKNFGDKVYRIGGDDFAILYPDVDQKQFEKELENLKIDLNKYHGLKSSICYSWNQNLENTKNILDEIDHLMYTGKQKYYIFNDQNKKYKFMLYSSLIRDIENKKFQVFLQPQLDLNSNKLTGAEAFVRRLDSENNIIPPLDFISFYECEGLISIIDFFVFEKVCEYLKTWEDNQFNSDDIKISVNFSRLTFDENNVVEKLKNICNKNQVSTSKIIIEITEAITNIDDKLFSKVIDDFRKEGFSVSLDDFGSENSSLATVSSNNFDEIKIHRHLIDNLLTNNTSRIITEFSIQMCRNLKGVNLVAKGIETEEQYLLLKEMNCEKGQGFYFDKPLNFDNFTEKYIIVH